MLTAFEKKVVSFCEDVLPKLSRVDELKAEIKRIESTIYTKENEPLISHIRRWNGVA